MYDYIILWLIGSYCLFCCLNCWVLIIRSSFRLNSIFFDMPSSFFFFLSTSLFSGTIQLFTCIFHLSCPSPRSITFSRYFVTKYLDNKIQVGCVPIALRSLFSLSLISRSYNSMCVVIVMHLIIIFIQSLFEYIYSIWIYIYVCVSAKQNIEFIPFVLNSNSTDVIVSILVHL